MVGVLRSAQCLLLGRSAPSLLVSGGEMIQVCDWQEILPKILKGCGSKSHVQWSFPTPTRKSQTPAQTSCVLQLNTVLTHLPGDRGQSPQIKGAVLRACPVHFRHHSQAHIVTCAFDPPAVPQRFPQPLLGFD